MAQVQVVSKGMRWSKEAADKALAEHKYIKIGDKAGNLLLSGAPGRWKNAATAGDVYVPSLRVAGNPGVIRNLFVSRGSPAATVDAHLARAYTAANYQGPLAPQFAAEIAAYKQYKGQRDAVKAATGGPKVTLGDLEYLVKNLGTASTVARTTAAGTARPVSPGRTTRVQALSKRLADATKNGKVIDVSKVDRVKGTGAKTSKRPGGNSKKIGVPGLAIVSSDAGNFDWAMDQLGPDYQRFKALYRQALQTKTAIAPAAAGFALPPAATMVPLGSPTAALPTFPAGTSPVVGGLPTIPGGFASPAGSPRL